MHFSASSLVATLGLISVASSAALPSAETNGTLSTLVERDSDYCYVDTWTNEGFRGYKERYDQPMSCTNFRAGMADKMSSFKVKNCLCIFYMDWNCQSFAFDADRRQDAEMSKNGPHNDKIRSIWCRGF